MKTKITPLKKLVTSFFVVLFFLLYTSIYAQTTHQVEVSSNVFTPSSITIQAGDKVVWTNVQGTHNVNGSKSVFPSNPESFGNSVGSGWTYEYVFTEAGEYDYQCDPHTWANMYGKVIVEGESNPGLFINFSNMTPHVGQNLWILVEDDDNGDIVYRASHVVEESFTIEVQDVQAGGDYNIEFYSDHNGNGYYDSPSTDHAWRIELTNIDASETVNFSHNTDFTDIEWEHMAILNLSGMTPHVGQEIYFALINTENGEIIERESEIVSENFTVSLSGIMPGNSYYIDFFSDHNGNGLYDAPSDDHAWRLEIPEVDGDEHIDFQHNTNFVDIGWKYRLKVNFSGMSPHLGQMLKLYVRDAVSGETVDSITIDELADEDFDLESYVINIGSSYKIDFFADHNGNGVYDAPPVDHAWRLNLSDVDGDEELDFTHNTSFVDISSDVTSYRDRASNNLNIIYPNPVMEDMTIRAELRMQSFMIMNNTGQKIMHMDLGKVKETSISLSELPAGLYFIQVNYEGELSDVKRFIKQ